MVYKLVTPPDRLNPERVARTRHDNDKDAADIEVTPVMKDRAWHLRHIYDIRRKVQCASDIGLNRVENVFRRGFKAWALMLLPNLRLKSACDGELKLHGIKHSVHNEPEGSENQAASSVPSSSI